MLPFLRDHHADPGRVHSDGRMTRVAIEDARERVAALVGARPREVVFTASGTEAVNAAVWGALARHGPGAVVTTAVEHSAVLASVARSGAPTRIVGVDRLGRVDVDRMTAAIDTDTALVSVQSANHEVGTIQPVTEIVAAARALGVLVHVDACASVGYEALDFAALDADLCSITAHKLGGPKGAAALLVRRGLRIPPFVVGGDQERARRAGIENIAAIVGFGAAAAELSGAALAVEAARTRGLGDRLLAGALATEGVHQLGDPEHRLPHLVCLGVEGVEAEPVLLGLDQRGISVHSGSSCSSEALEPSPVLAAMGVDSERSLRPSVGWSSTDADVDAFCAAFGEVVTKLRALRG